MESVQGTRRAELYGLLGDLPDRTRPVGGVLLSSEEQPSYVLDTLLLDLNGIEPVPAYLARPRHVVGRLPVVLYNHSHGVEAGKREFLDGNAAIRQQPYAAALAGRGYAALCIDAWGFGERRGRSEAEIFKHMLWHGQVMWGMMVYDSLRAIDYLLARDDVDPGRVATLGPSMGSTMAWWVAALDERVKVCVDICCLTDYQALIETQGLDGHGIYYYVPRLLKHFTTAEINALIAPRPHLSLAGDFDPLTPPAGLTRVDEALCRVYSDLGAPEAWRLVRSATGHFETAAMRGEILGFLERWL